MRAAINAAAARDASVMTTLISIVIGCVLIGTPLSLLLNYVLSVNSQRIGSYLATTLLAHLLSWPTCKLEREHSGELVARFNNDVSPVLALLHWETQTLLFGVILGGAGVISAFVFSPVLGGWILLSGLITVFVNVRGAQTLRPFTDAMQAKLGNMSERLSDLIQSLPVSKLFHLSPKLLSEFKRENRAQAEASIQHGYVLGNLWTFNVARQEFVSYTITLALGLWLVSQGRLDIGAVFAVIAFEFGAGLIFRNLGDFVAATQHSLSASQRIRGVLEVRDESDDRRQTEDDTAHKPSHERPRRLGNLRGLASEQVAAIEIRQLGFSYGDDANAIDALTNITLSVPRGQTVALVGPSGGGKSTLVKLLLGFYPFERGEIYMNGHPIQTLTLEHLRTMSAYVSQDPYLFDMTIAENIRFGRPAASDAEVEAAARAAHAHEFIRAIPENYGARVGERGVKLSGGQRQRIALARAILKDAPVLLLDEATSALDAESELLVQQALEVLMRDRATLVVAHRLSTVQSANLICVLDGGRIVERGTHAELLAQGGLYLRLVAAGFGDSVS